MYCPPWGRGGGILLDIIFRKNIERGLKKLCKKWKKELRLGAMGGQCGKRIKYF
jgi:hypothetical protein